MGETIRRKIMSDKQSIKHESYAMLGISRCSSGGGRNLFGSSIKHRNTIRLRIKPAEVMRNSNRDWFHGVGGLPYIEVEMSYSQFAEAITAMNCGDGVPVTLTYLNGKSIEECPQTDKRQEFEEEFQKDMTELTTSLKKLTAQAEKILSDKKPPTKTDKESILCAIKSLRQEIEHNIPFMQTSFNEQMDKTVLEAKGEVEGFVMNKLISAGLEGLQKEMKMLE
jgi:hypothetical protein